MPQLTATRSNQQYPRSAGSLAVLSEVRRISTGCRPFRTSARVYSRGSNGKEYACAAIRCDDCASDILPRCAQRMFLRPDPATHQTFLYCLFHAESRWDIMMVLPSTMSNRHHTIIYDRHGQVIEFMQTHAATRARHASAAPMFAAGELRVID